MTDLAAFRRETRGWLAEHCPLSMRTRMVPGEEITGSTKRRSTNPDAYVWLQNMVSGGGRCRPGRRSMVVAGSTKTSS